MPNEESMANDENISKEINQKSRPQRVKTKPNRNGFMCTENSTDIGKLMLEQELQGPDKEHWEQAVKDDLQSFEENGAWEVLDAPSGGTIVKCKWVFKKKCDSDNNVQYRYFIITAITPH
ncbi:Retrovirus-related Pol polyprotein from transposon TNT 1-94 [Operophtera brumata]|uniref:Retrovirus-related Pol polyprotein from transposon TNT 1-94 n=1 Tax=Operophtera brumata TaxID=104452 RepID=A0A0L7KR35_OPEBR|nr:Retrovirus-related Pol polyprotein from transposon TNT 1-94 [Operophtera brumata]